jgi:hypothetical protein
VLALTTDLSKAAYEVGEVGEVGEVVTVTHDLVPATQGVAGTMRCELREKNWDVARWLVRWGMVEVD